MQRIEKRYLVDDPADVIRACSGMANNTYYVRTVYLDHDPPTWSVGLSAKKYRLRTYNGNNEDIYFEIKVRKGDSVTKVRRKVKKWTDLKGVATVGYLRREYSADGLRITIDVSVTTNRAELPHAVVEIKKTKDVDTTWLEALLPAENEEFSKSKWALGLWTEK